MIHAPLLAVSIASDTRKVARLDNFSGIVPPLLILFVCLGLLFLAFFSVRGLAWPIAAGA